MIELGTATAVPPQRAAGDDKQWYAADDHAPGDARRHVRAKLGTWRLAHIAETVELVVSELVTNAVRHSGDDGVILWLTQTGSSVIVHVHDASPEQPVRRKAGADDEDGRGLTIVDALSIRTGCRPAEPGKITWAEIMK